MLKLYTIIHVIISLIGIAAGFVVMYGMLTGMRLEGWTLTFLITTVLTSATGFGFPVKHFMPSHALGIISLLVLPVAIYALYAGHLEGSWRWIYVVSAILAQYFNVFVLVVQLFQKAPALHVLAPTQSEPPFAIAQFMVLVLFVIFGILAVVKFHPEPNGTVPPTTGAQSLDRETGPVA